MLRVLASIAVLIGGIALSGIFDNSALTIVGVCLSVFFSLKVLSRASIDYTDDPHSTMRRYIYIYEIITGRDITRGGRKK